MKTARFCEHASGMYLLCLILIEVTWLALCASKVSSMTQHSTFISTVLFHSSHHVLVVKMKFKRALAAAIYRFMLQVRTYSQKYQ